MTKALDSREPVHLLYLTLYWAALLSTFWVVYQLIFVNRCDTGCNLFEWRAALATDFGAWVFLGALGLGLLIVWVSAIRSSAGRGQWVWFALILVGAPFVAPAYFILDKTGWGGFTNCKGCW